jgi:exopolyphosphatase/guanosine-5'-triphosphate,3'-diphosphate pyrophosphatase
MKMVDPQTQAEAEILGKAMRFGAMLWMDKVAELGEMRWYPKKKELHLRLAAEMMPLFGEVAEARFTSLAESLGAQALVKKTKT